MADKLIGGLTPTAAVVLTDKVPKEPTAGPPAEYFLVSQLVTLLNTIYAPITGGAYVLKSGDTMTGLLTIAQATANTSNLILSGQSLTGANAQSLLSMTGTWNTSGNPVALRLAITDTASGGTSKLLEVLGGAGGATSLFSVSKAGTAMAETLGSVQAALLTGGAYFGSGASSILVYNSSANVLTIDTGVPGTLTLVKWGGTTSSFPAIKRSAALLQGRLADDSAYCDIEGRLLRTATAFTVATLPAAGTAGRRAYVTDALTPAFLTVVVGGGAVITPVFDNGTNWIGG